MTGAVARQTPGGTSDSSTISQLDFTTAEFGERRPPRNRADQGFSMTNSEWWARVVQARTRHADLLPQRVWPLHKGEHEAPIDLRAVPGDGAEIVLTVDGELRRTRLYRAHEQAELSGITRA